MVIRSEVKKYGQILRRFIVGSALAVLGMCVTVNSGRANFLSTAHGNPAGERHSDTSGVLLFVQAENKWRADCKDDDLEDRRDCVVTKGSGGLTVILGSSMIPDSSMIPSAVVTLRGEQYPGSEMIIKIDDDKPVRWKEDNYPFAVFKQIVERLKTGSQVHTRYTEWPSGNQVDEKLSLAGFTSAYEEAVRRVLAYKK